MVHAKNIWFQILITIMFLLAVWFGSSERVEAEEYVFGVDYNYYAIEQSTASNGTVIRYEFYFKSPYVLFTFIHNEYNQGQVYLYNHESGEFLLATKTYGLESYIKDYYKNDVLYSSGERGPNNGALIKISNLVSSNIYQFADMESAQNYFLYGDDSGLLWKPSSDPLWGFAKYEPTLELNDFKASVTGSAMSASWNGVSRWNLVINNYENTYVKFVFGIAPKPETPGIFSNVLYDKYCKISDNAFEVSLEDIGVTEGYYLNYVKATPYYYYDDDTENTLYKGNTSVVYLDSEGIVTDTEVVNPDVTYDEEDTSKSIFDSITNFFSNFFTNLLDLIKSAVVPSQEDLQLLLDEMTEWFSDRLGFIWYPFDLAITLVGALAGGEASSVITVPALTLNMFDGITLWEEFSFDMDAIGIFQYVRYFTSAIMCGGVVVLARNKWDEWIGGRSS